MKSLIFSEFYAGKYDDHGYELYIIKDSDENVMYIGIAKDSIWHRWFGGKIGHMDSDANGKLYGKSRIGEVIERRFPNSWNWVIELWTKDDCLNACRQDIVGRDLDTMEIGSIEPYMIDRFEPIYNITYGDGRHEDPLTTKKLDDIYKRLFG